VTEHLPAPRWRDLTSPRDKWLDTELGFVEATSRDTKLNLVERDVHLVRTIVLLSEGQHRFRVGGFRLIQLAEVGVREPDVVENLRRLIAHAESSVAGEAPLKGFERFPNVAPDAGDGAEILVDHRHRLGILD